jgi:ADP-ribose pyrophosphatase YjhB (NUDIX family)
MTTTRRFAAFNRTNVPPRTGEIPEGGLCLSAFVILSQRGKPHHILMGKVNDMAPWDHLAALDQSRIQKVKGGWMLPSSHLLLFESPEDAARRILREQLNITDQELSKPISFAEAYGPNNHWDFHFIFRGELDTITPTDAWTELRFVDVTTLSKQEIARAQDDILGYAGEL